MKVIQKSLLALASTVFLAGSVFGADEFKAFPIFTDENFDPNIEVALVAGHMSPSNKDLKSAMMYGLEVSLDCPVFTLPGENLLRQQFSVNRYSKNSVDITTIEVNPYYFINLSENFVVGFGPGIGGAHVDVDGGARTWMFTYQVGAGVKYYFNEDVFAGVDLRQQWSVEKDYLQSGTKEDVENFRAMAKVGYRF
jgi:opacity protein-like surface antigen